MAAKHETEIARQLFLYGAGDGKRILSVNGLIKATGLSVDTINRHMPKWKKESEEMLSGSSDCGLALRLSKETLNDHNLDMIHLRSDINSIKFEMENLDNMIEKLQNICENFSLNSENGDDAIKLFDRYLRASLNKMSLRGQFLAAEKRWVELSGIVALTDIQITKEKALATGRAKLKLKAEESEAGMKPVVPVTHGVFSRPTADDETEVTDD